MQGIHDIVKIQRISGGLVDILAPGRGAYQDDGVLVVCANNGNHLIGIAFHAFPCGVAVGLIADFIYNICVIGILGGYFLKEGKSVRFMDVRVSIVQHMPVHDHIHILAGGVGYAVSDNAL